MFKKLGAVLSLAMVAIMLTIIPAFAANDNINGPKTGESTTLDACGYFAGTQTASESSDYTSDGVTYHTERGTWTGVFNNYDNGPVASLGTVQGAYTESYTIDDATGSFSGTEQFTSNAGKIDQTFSFTPGWTVSVTATRDLSFLTSDTNGACYTGPWPRP